MTQPDFLVVGNFTRDITPEGGARLGGTALYASLAARSLGFWVAVVGRAQPDLDIAKELPDVHVVLLPSPATTTFENIYSPSGRRQRLVANAGAIGASDVPPTLARCPAVLLAPIAGELEEGIATLFSGAVVGASLQGWLREVGPGGWVARAPARQVERLLPLVQVAFCSDEDVGGDEDVLRAFAGLAPLLVVTRGAGGSTVWERGERRHVPAFPASAVDPTGAGDCFAAAFLAHYRSSGDAYSAARLGACVAAFVVEAVGTKGIPSLEQVCRRLEEAGERNIWPPRVRRPGDP